MQLSALYLYNINYVFTPENSGFRLGLLTPARQLYTPTPQISVYLFNYLGPFFVTEFQLSQSLVNGHSSYLDSRVTNKRKIYKVNVLFLIKSRSLT